MITFLKTHEPEMFALLEKIVRVQSGSHNKEGVDQVARVIQDALQSNRVSTHLLEQATFGNHLIVRSLCEQRFNRQILLVGHMDTVFPKDTDFNGYREDRTRCFGPGVIDMKGGLVTGISALKALDNENLLSEIPIAFIFNSDEEIGSPTSRSLIKQEAKSSAFAFVLEAGGLDGEIVTGRKGNISLELNIEGRAGHAAFAGREKASAVLALAHKIIAFEGLNDIEKGITVNVGKANGGIGPNTVPENATARIDVRFFTKSDQARLEEGVLDITRKQNVPNTSANFSILSQRPPMPVAESNKRLYQAVRDTAESLGLTVKEEFRAGVSDANLIAEENVPVIDGLGTIGAGDHSKDEYMIKESLLQRSTLLACAIAECWEKHKRGLLF